MTRIVELWRSGEVPVECGLFRADGTSREADCESPTLANYVLGEPLDLDALLADDPDWTTSPAVWAEVELPGRAGYLCSGGGSHGSDGFFARLDADQNLVWVVHLLSNEFVRIDVDWPRATFTNNWGNTLTIDLTDPDYAAP
ncbi:hypothetical protein [Kitasatospora sp. NPDC059827]|uniref:hypothetical protein n=1 Tax=Kitasatospora sp. NPDC059827 TaxID=3346964 RepID=UPI00365651D3